LNQAKEKIEDTETAERRSEQDRRNRQRRSSAATLLEEGMLVFSQHDTGDQAYIVKSGKIEIFTTVDGQDTTLGTLEEGALFGEMALIDNSERMASARAVGGPAEIYTITRGRFEEQLAGANPFIAKLLHILAGNVRANSDLINNPEPPELDTSDADE
jgi:CRP-like cAMP-binding protein|tara:strand:- start:429 stop:902 length:474 start_codon:yes stop_codon:yes gene_type:complete